MLGSGCRDRSIIGLNIGERKKSGDVSNGKDSVGIRDWWSSGKGLEANEIFSEWVDEYGYFFTSKLARLNGVG